MNKYRRFFPLVDALNSNNNERVNRKSGEAQLFNYSLNSLKTTTSLFISWTVSFVF